MGGLGTEIPALILGFTPNTSNAVPSLGDYESHAIGSLPGCRRSMRVFELSQAHLTGSICSARWFRPDGNYLRRGFQTGTAEDLEFSTAPADQ
jgi:hypothetical protein